MLLYTWKDVERKLLLNKEHLEPVIVDIETYTNELIIYLKDETDKDSAICRLKSVLQENYDSEQQRIALNLPGEQLKVIFEVDEDPRHTNVMIPLFRNVLYQKSAYYGDLIQKELPGVPIIAFHSYKGGVGRTLSLLTFVKAWSALKELKNSKKLLIVDADIEAPGITWLMGNPEEAGFSFLDLLEITQQKDSADEIIELIADIAAESTIRIETEKSIVEHVVLPTYRYIEQLMDMYASPESLALSYNKKYILAEVLSKLGERLNAELVLVDLRAGLSEFSAPLLFDPRVKKYLVTSTSYQSVKGTEILLNQLSKGLPLDKNTKIPEIFLTMGLENVNTIDIISELTAVYDKQISVSNSLAADDDSTVTVDLVTELPFASELVHLTSLQKIMKSLDGREFYKNILKIVQNSYVVRVEEETGKAGLTREKAIALIHDFAVNQITAEGNRRFEVLMTSPIQNLIKKYKNHVPNTVIMGAKGSGKTFLYREILRNQFWERFVCGMDRRVIKHPESTRESTLTVPLLASGNAGGFHEIIANAVQTFNQNSLNGKLKNSVYIDNRDILMAEKKVEHDRLEWKKIWEKVILTALCNEYSSLEELDEELNKRGKKTVFLIDGLEEIFLETISSENEKNAIAALCVDFISEIKAKYNSFGLIVFLRKDMARDAITVNFEQFNSLYRSVELQWSSTEALRLVVWLVSQVIPHFYQDEVEIELAPKEIIDQTLNRLWGVKLGKPTSSEAYSSRWILAALSDFNGQLQARDIIRFLANATISVGKEVYLDRYLMPVEIKKAVSACSKEKISEIKQEIKALEPIFDKLENASAERKVLPFHQGDFQLSPAEEKIMKQEGYLRIENDKYYLPEIIRYALKFKYERGARPRVLSLLLR